MILSKTTINNFVVLGKKSISIDESDRWCSPGPSVAGAGRGGGEQNQYEQMEPQISPLTKCCQVRICVVKWGYDVMKNVPTTEEDQNIRPLHQDPHIYTPGIVISQNITFTRVLIK